MLGAGYESGFTVWRPGLKLNGKNWQNLSARGILSNGGNHLMTTMNISLPVPLKKFIQDQVKRGGYGTVSEYLRDLVRAEQRRKAQIKLEKLLLEGVRSGKSSQMSSEDWSDIRAKVLKRRSRRK